MNHSLKLTRVDTALLQLLHLGLTADAAFDEEKWPALTDDEWRETYLKAIKQGIVPATYDAIQKMPQNLRPSKIVMVNWALVMGETEKAYPIHCRMAAKLREFCLMHDISSVVLKGVGLSPLYPVPAHRKIGDIDIFTLSADHTKLTDEEANRLTEKLLFEQGATLHDAAATTPDSREVGFDFHDILIENHHMFINLGKDDFNKQVEKLLHRYLAPSTIRLGDYTIGIPSVEFNRLYLPFHTATHFIGRGLSLHHFADWYSFLQRYGFELPEGITDAPFLSFVRAMTFLCVRYLDLGNTDILVTPHEKALADRLLNEVLHTPYLGKQTSPLKAMYFKFRHYAYSRQNAKLSIGCNSLLREATSRIISNIKEGRIFHLS
jgi:hypothetical protein